MHWNVSTCTGVLVCALECERLHGVLACALECERLHGSVSVCTEMRALAREC